MLDRATRIRWTQDVVAYLNRDTDGTALGADLSLTGGDPQWRRAAPPEKIRAEIEGELRWFAGELRKLRERATKEHWSAAERATIQIAAPVRKTHGDYWLDLEASERAGDSSFIAALNYDEAGRIVMRPGGDLAPTAMLALTIAELYAADSPVEVKVCQLEKCAKLFVHEIIGQRRPPEYCPGTNHSARQRKLNFNHPKPKMKRKRNRK